jgi:ketosteroid isomerase-like protein
MLLTSSRNGKIFRARTIKRKFTRRSMCIMTAPSNARKLWRFSRRASSSFIILALSLALASSAFAQKNKKKNQADAPPPPNPMLSLPPEQQIDYMISELLGAWQVGDVEKLHSHYADDVSVVNGSWAPPIVGWPAYLASYQSQRARTQQVRLDRLNTLVRVDGNFAWASYQWDFSGVVDGTPTTAEGQTTLVLEKRGDKWIVVHNHTSVVPGAQPASAVGTAPTPTPAAKP